MQMRQSQLRGDRPDCPTNPLHKVHRHGFYKRFANCDELCQSQRIFRWLCLLCGHTISVLPDWMLPYRPVSAPLVQEHFDARVADQLAPPVTEKEQGCLKRAWHRFTLRTAALAALLGQMMQMGQPTAKLIWLQLRQWGSLSAILLQLARPFNTSLLHDYRCLRPWSGPSG